MSYEILDKYLRYKEYQIFAYGFYSGIFGKCSAAKFIIVHTTTNKSFAYQVFIDNDLLFKLRKEEKIAKFNDYKKLEFSIIKGLFIWVFQQLNNEDKKFRKDRNILFQSKHEKDLLKLVKNAKGIRGLLLGIK